MNLLSLLVETTAKSSAVMVAALIAVACLRRRSAALRHWILSAAVVAALLTPALSLITPVWHLPLDRLTPPRVLATSTTVRPIDASPRERIDIPTQGPDRMSLAGAAAMISTGWLLGAAIAVLILIAGLGRLATIASRARPVI